MKVLVCGGRNYADAEFVKLVLDQVWERDGRAGLHIIHGGATGADALAAAWVKDKKCTCCKAQAYPANWAQYGKAAGPIRNQVMLDEARPELVVAFPGGSGTRDMIRRARAAGVRVERYSAIRGSQAE